MNVTTSAGPEVETRIPLSRERILRAAVRIADEGGIGAVTMRRIAEELHAEAMSLYHHVANKDDVLDGIVDVVAREIAAAVGSIETSDREADWATAVRRRILTARAVMLRHPWAPQVLESRTSASLEILRYYDGLIGLMRSGGFSNDLAHHAMHALGSRALGFTQELFDPAAGGGGDGAAMAGMAGRLPSLVGMVMEVSHGDPTTTLGWCDDQTEFEFGLDLILEGLDRRIRRA